MEETSLRLAVRRRLLDIILGLFIAQLLANNEIDLNNIFLLCVYVVWRVFVVVVIGVVVVLVGCWPVGRGSPQRPSTWPHHPTFSRFF